MRELIAEFPDIKWCGDRDLSPDKNGNGVIEAFKHIKASSCQMKEADESELF